MRVIAQDRPAPVRKLASMFKCVTLLLLLASNAVLAQWELDTASSSLNFVSIKNDRIAETHSFKSMVGFIGEDGTIKFTIDLDSVDTAIEVRDERMRELLFQTVQFPLATVTAEVEPGILEAVAAGGVVNSELKARLTLHGVDADLQVPVVVVGEPLGQLRVLSSRPVVVSAADFGLAEGVAALQKVAGLDSISTAVPVTFQLVFVPARNKQRN